VSSRLKRVLLWIATLMWAAVIFYMSSRPGSTLPGGFSVEGHLGEYFVFGLLLTLALTDKPPSLAVVALAIGIASLYGVSDEFHQHFVPMRTPDPADWALDTLGAAAGAFFARALRLRAVRRRESGTGGETS
jgi:VanZ family protein